MQRNDLYIGFPNQQGKVIRELQSVLGRSKSGVYLVTGGIRVGKTSIIKSLESSYGLRYSLPTYEGDFQQLLKEYEFIRRFSNPSDIIFSTAEIPVSNSGVLQVLNHIVQSEISNGNNIRIIGDVVTKRFPAWNSEGNNKHIANTLRNYFESKFLKLYPMDTDQKRLAEGIWEMRNSEHASVWSQTAEELGFPPSYSPFWEQFPSPKNQFVEGLVRVMKRNPNGNIEGQRRGGERF